MSEPLPDVTVSLSDAFVEAVADRVGVILAKRRGMPGGGSQLRRRPTTSVPGRSGSMTCAPPGRCAEPVTVAGH